MPVTTFVDETQFSNSTLQVDTGDSLVVQQGVAVSTLSEAVAILGYGGNDIVINGAVSGGCAVESQGNSSLTIGSAALCSGTSSGVITDSDDVVNNRGTIFGNEAGILAGGSGSSTMNNFGQILSGPNGAQAIDVSFLGTYHLNNSGLIEAQKAGGASYSSTSVVGIDVVGIDIINNKGTMIGDVLLGPGADVFRGGSGKVVGTIDGGAGEDRIVAGRFHDVLFGGADNDRLSGGKGSDEFQFALGTGSDIITDFDATGGGKSQDYVSLAAGTVYVERSAHNGLDTILDFGGGQTLTLLGVRNQDFSHADIHFSL